MGRPAGRMAKASDSEVAGPGFKPRRSACGGIDMQMDPSNRQGVAGFSGRRRSPKETKLAPILGHGSCVPVPILNIVKVCEPM